MGPTCPPATPKTTPCPSSWASLGGRCYRYFNETLTFWAATVRCRVYGQLAGYEGTEAACALEYLGVEDTDVWVKKQPPFSECRLTRTPARNSIAWCNNKYQVLCSAGTGSDASIKQILVDGLNVSSSTTSLPVPRSSRLQVRCESEGEPNPSTAITWKKARYGGANSHTATATIRPKCEDSGQVLSCLARNKFGDAEPRHIQIMVKCPPSVTSFTYSQEGALYLGHTTLQFQCSASGFPPPALRLFREDTGQTLLTAAGQNILRHEFQGWSCVDTAFYGCQIMGEGEGEGEGEQGGADTIRSLRVGINTCPPVLCINQSQAQNMYYAARGTTLFVHVCVKVFDGLHYSYKINNTYQSQRKYKFATSKLDELRFEIRIKIIDVGQADYGLINVTIYSRSYNKLFYVFHLLDPGPPRLCSNQSQDEVIFADLGDTILAPLCVTAIESCQIDVRINGELIRASNAKYVIVIDRIEPLQCNINIQVTNITAADFGRVDVTLLTAAWELHSTLHLRKRVPPTSSSPERFAEPPSSDDDSVLPTILAVTGCVLVIAILVVVLVVYMYKKKELRLRKVRRKRVRDEPDGQYANLGTLNEGSAEVTNGPTGGQRSQPDNSADGGSGGSAGGGNGAAVNSNDGPKTENLNNEGLVYATVVHTAKNPKTKPKRTKKVDEDSGSAVEYVNLIDLSDEKTTEKNNDELTYISIAHAAKANTVKREPSRIEERVEYAPLDFAKMEEVFSAVGPSQDGEDFSDENTREQKEGELTYASIAHTSRSSTVKKPKRGNSYTEERVEYVTLDFARMEEVSSNGEERQDGAEKEES